MCFIVLETTFLRNSLRCIKYVELMIVVPSEMLGGLLRGHLCYPILDKIGLFRNNINNLQVKHPCCVFQ